MHWKLPPFGRRVLSLSICTLALLSLGANRRGLRSSAPPPGVEYKNYVVSEVPWSIHVIKIDRAHSEFELTTTLGGNGGTQIGLSPLTYQLRTVPRDFGTPVAAINGDFYALDRETFAGDPRGLHIKRGELVSDPINRACFWIDASGNPQAGDVTSKFSITWPNGENTTFGLNEERGNGTVLYSPAAGDTTQTSGGTELILEKVNARKWLPIEPGSIFPARIREIRRSGNTPIAKDTLVLSLPGRRSPTVEVGDTLMISTDTQPSLKGVRTAIGGGPMLVRAGKAAPGRASKSNERHPRSAVGWNKNFFFFVEVDGRQPGLSMGMDVRELADFLVKIGCDEGMNLDGGGSAELWLNGEIMNSPCFGHERSTATAIVLVQKKVQVQP